MKELLANDPLDKPPNRDYISDNTYSTYIPDMKQYTEFNNFRKQKAADFNEELNCGDCLRGGWVYCTKSDGFGSIYGNPGQVYPVGKCC